MELIPFLAIAIFGVLTSFGHCIGMCGGVVVAYSSIKGKNPLGDILYSLGRITSYTILGVATALVFYIFSHTVEALFLVVLSLVMMLFALSLLGKIKIFTLATTGTIGQQEWFKKLFAKLVASKSIFSFFGIGILSGFLPCAPVYVAIAVALSTDSIVSVALIMAVYGVATSPSLFILSNRAGFMKEVSYRDLFNKLSAFTVFLYALFTLFRVWL